jgi:hypothetical protein
VEKPIHRLPPLNHERNYLALPGLIGLMMERRDFFATFEMYEAKVCHSPVGRDGNNIGGSFYA